MLFWNTEYDRKVVPTSFQQENRVLPDSQLHMPTKLHKNKILPIPNVDVLALKC